jgi:hypothetical protein
MSVNTDTFTGDGSTITYSLSVTPQNVNFITVNIDGVSQLKTAYNLSNNILTFTGIPDAGAVIDVKTWNAASVGVLTGLVYDSFTGNGSTVAYTLSTSPTNKNFTIVTIGGITQNKNNYTVSGTTLTFSTAPPNTSPIEVMTFGPAVNTVAASGSNTQIQFNNGGALGGSPALTFASNTLTAGNLVVSTTANLGAAANLTITGGSNGQVLVSNGAGGVSWVDSPSMSAAKTTGYNLVFGG